jgi:hypothetical protein
MVPKAMQDEWWTYQYIRSKREELTKKLVVYVEQIEDMRRQAEHEQRLLAEQAGELRRYADTFFLLIADHGRFNIKQLYDYVSLRTCRRIDSEEERALLAYARVNGGAPEKGAIAPIYRMPVKRKKPLPKGKADKATIDMFGGR